MNDESGNGRRSASRTSPNSEASRRRTRFNAKAQRGGGAKVFDQHHRYRAPQPRTPSALGRKGNHLRDHVHVVRFPPASARFACSRALLEGPQNPKSSGRHGGRVSSHLPVSQTWFNTGNRRARGAGQRKPICVFAPLRFLLHPDLATKGRIEESIRGEATHNRDEGGGRGDSVSASRMQ